MSEISRWPSLAGQVAVAQTLYGEAGPTRVADWLAGQLSFVGDREFARLFADHIDLPGVGEMDYAHRHVRTVRGELVGGIRFYGRDVGRPFVEVVAHSFTDAADLADCVQSEWAAFGPQAMRLMAPPGELRGPTVVDDQQVYVAHVSRMTRPDGRVELVAIEDPDAALAMIDIRYRGLRDGNPDLADDLARADPDDVRDWVRKGEIEAIRAGGSTAGLLAVADGEIAWIAGAEVMEEVVAVSDAGHGYAAAAQAVWASRAAAATPARLMIGTIDHRNQPSRRTAARAGRVAVLEMKFVRLT